MWIFNGILLLFIFILIFVNLEYILYVFNSVQFVETCFIVHNIFYLSRFPCALSRVPRALESQLNPGSNIVVPAFYILVNFLSAYVIYHLERSVGVFLWMFSILSVLQSSFKKCVSKFCFVCIHCHFLLN